MSHIDMRGWYSSLGSQVLDIVSDYAGRELFCVEGDSIMLQCLDDPTLDFDSGFQLLHAVYTVERFLSKLLATKCVFHIVFFDENRETSKNLAPNCLHRSKFQLAREIIYQHLNSRLPEKYPDLQVHRFKSTSSAAFREYVQVYNVYFVMCHNGIVQRQTDSAVEDMLRIICNVMALGLDVAVINEIEWRDNKVLTRVIRASTSTRRIIELDDKCTTLALMSPFLNRCLLASQSIGKLKEEVPDLRMTAREVLTLVVASALVAESQGEKMKRMIAALLLHLKCLKDLSLQERRMGVQVTPHEIFYMDFVDKFCKASTIVLQTEEWKNFKDHLENNDLHDLIDGRILRSCVAFSLDHEIADLVGRMSCGYETILDCFRKIENLGSTQSFFFNEKKHLCIASLKIGDSANSVENEVDASLLPFEHPVFDEHLATIRVTVQDSDEVEDIGQHFYDRNHWHTRRLLGSKHRTLPQQLVTKWNNPSRWNQKRFRDMTKYAASLTNAKGNALKYQVIFSSDVSRKGQSKVNKPSSKAKSLIERNEAEKAKKEEKSWVDSWKEKLREVQKRATHHQLKEVRDYLEGQGGRKRAFLEPEVRLYLLSLLISQGQRQSPPHEDDSRTALAKDIWDQIRVLRQKVNQMSVQSYQMFHDVCHRLGITDIPSPSSSLPNRPLNFQFNCYFIKPQQLGAPLDFQAFQLLHCGPLMDRHTGAQPDARVDFEPDKWQRDVLDELDQNHSIFVVAPTSAGKTFISFYAMTKVLQEDDTGVLVYVAPTKALVNQIAAEIHARFRKTYPDPEQTVWAIHTRDLRINDPMKCQILVTVPHLLQIMLLAPTNATTWAPRVKCIIFDEIHSIGQTEDGVVWEQLLLLAPCRIIALSATVGNPIEFADWLESTQRSLGIPMKLVQYKQRYSDLRKYIYTPAAPTHFNGLSRPRPKGILEAEFIKGLQPLHPVSSIVSQQRQMPEDLSLEPRDCYVLWKCMVKHASSQFPVPEYLDPQYAMPSFIGRSDVYEWEAKLKKFLSTWTQDSRSPFKSVRNELLSVFSQAHVSQDQTINEVTEGDSISSKSTKLCTSVFPLLVDLHHQNALPALLFNYERTTCEKIAITTLNQLVNAEDEYKTSTTWKKKMIEYENYNLLLSKQARIAEKSKKQNKRKQSQTEEEPASPMVEDESPFKGFDADRPLEQFTFANTRNFTWVELLEEIEGMKKHKVNPLLLEALKRGIGVHHAGLNRRYRQCVERLFRGGFLRVVVATGTLALGINMPCSTVIFCGDSVFLTALNFRQAAGRAGRRGFDLLGNVIFHGIPQHKAYQLMSSRLPDLNGHFPITTSLVLRLFILLHNSKESSYAVRAINSLLSQPRFSFGSADSKEKVLHHLRFSIEYLRRQCLLGRHGEPIRLASIVAHLYYTENSAFAFHALLKGGYFETLCQEYGSNTEKKLRILMIVLAHLFGRKSLGHHYKDLQERKEEIKSPSAVLLPSMPREAATEIRLHNQSVLKTYSAYVTTFISQHLKEPERELPLSKLPVGGCGNLELSRSLGVLRANQSRSAFFGLSGHGDRFETIKDLCNTVRSDVFLEESVIPHLDIYPDGGMAPLNAYLYDFFCHGSLEPLQVANRISRSDSWFLLNDFSLVLATIIVSLETHLDPDRAQSHLEDQLEMGSSVSSLSEEDKDSGFAIQVGPQHTATNGLNGSKQGAGPRKSAEPLPNEELPDNWDDISEDGELSDEFIENSYADSPGTTNDTHTPIVSLEVLQTFRELKEQFDEKFHAIFA